MRLILEARAPDAIGSPNGRRWPPSPRRPRYVAIIALAVFLVAAGLGARHWWQQREVPVGRTLDSVEADMREVFAAEFCEGDIENCTDAQREQLEADVRNLRRIWRDR